MINRLLIIAFYPTVTIYEQELVLNAKIKNPYLPQGT